MLRQDYILDLITRAAALLARAMGVALNTDRPLDATELDAAARELTGLPLSLAELLDVEAVRDALGEGPRAAAQAASLGILLAARGHLLLAEGAGDAGRAALEKGLLLMRGAAVVLPVTPPGLLEAMRAAEDALGRTP